jgi:hypothetical protein
MVTVKESQHGQLFWWRETTQLHTLITIWGYPLAVASRAPSFLLTFRLFDTQGKLQTTWQHLLAAPECLFLDSAHCPTTQDLAITEGVLALSITTQDDEAVEVPPGLLCSIIDWYSEAGELVSLHSDQVMQPRSKPVKWTEIVIQETVESQNSLVILNGAESQPAQSINLEIKNYLGETCTAIFAPEIAPFSVNQLQLADLFPQILKFCQNRSLTVTGTFTSSGVFIRPYVVNQGQHLGAYHGGNLYSWPNLPAISYKFMGAGEVNPMLAIHQDDITTTINLLNTHGELEQDFWVDADLYDCAGQLVATRQKWLLAQRHQLCRAEISDLLPGRTTNFIGHVALRFSNDQHAEYPRRLQALMEYRTPQSVARVMAWSDVWNWQERSRSSPDINYLAYYRVWWQQPFTSYVSLTNCGIDAGYDRTATYRLRLENGQGDFLVKEGTIPPQGTMYQAIHELFPTISEFLGDQPVGLVVLETTADLASMHLTHQHNSGVYAAEHFLPAYTRYNDKLYSPCGS